MIIYILNVTVFNILIILITLLFIMTIIMLSNRNNLFCFNNLFNFLHYKTTNMQHEIKNFSVHFYIIKYCSKLKGIIISFKLYVHLKSMKIHINFTCKILYLTFLFVSLSMPSCSKLLERITSRFGWHTAMLAGQECVNEII